MDVDVAVIGGGPAGAVVARCLASWGRGVAMIERSDYSERRYGETLPPETTPLLARLGLRDDLAPVDAVGSPGTLSYWGTAEPVESDFVRNVHGPGLHVDRAAFDRALAQAASRSGACVVAGVEVTAASRHAGGWRLETTGERIDARFLVDAAGRGSRVAARRRVRHGDKLLAMTSLRRHRGRRPPDLRTCVESAPRGWWYSSPVGARDTVLMFFTDAQEHRNGIVVADELERSALTRTRVAGAETVDERMLPVTSGLREPLTGTGWLAAGDSAATLDPISGAGIHKALGQGALAAAAAHATLEGDPGALEAYAARVRADFGRYAATRRLTYAAERRWRAEGFWERRLAAAS